MRLSLVVVAATASATVKAFKDTSPFILFSSSPLPDTFRATPHKQLESRSQVLKTAKLFLSYCPSEIYYVLTQPSLSAQELSTNAPHIRHALKDQGVNFRLPIAEAVGLHANDGEELVQYLEHQCGSKRAEGWELDAIQEQREQDSSIVVTKTFEESIEDTDASLYTDVLKDIIKDYKYTIILTSTSADSTSDVPPYEADSREPLHKDLKRQLHARARNISDKADLRPLFEKYQFLSPGLFMGISVSVILLAILSVGISAVASLEVSYGAFDKDMGPAAPKKQ